MWLRREEEALGMQLRDGDGKQLNYFRGQFRNSSFPFYQEPVWSPMKKGNAERKSISEGPANCMAVRRYLLISNEKKGPFKTTKLLYK